MANSPSPSPLETAATSFQQEDSDFAFRNERCVLGHATGLGKTFISMLTWRKWLAAGQRVDRVLIVGTKSSLMTWQSQLLKWCGINTISLKGYSDPLWETALNKNIPGVYIVSYASFRGLVWSVPKSRKMSFDLVILDELDQFLRKRNLTFKALKRVQSRYFIGCTATWASRGPQDLWPILNYISPKEFRSYWQFIYTWCIVEKGVFGVEIGGPRDAAKLAAMLRGSYYVSRTWAEAGRQFVTSPANPAEPNKVCGPVIRRPLRLPMSATQRKLYDALERDMYLICENQTILTSSRLATLMKLQQLALCPRIVVERGEYGPAIDYLVGQVKEEPHTVIFSPFRTALNCLEQGLLTSGINKNRVFKIMGGTEPAELPEIIAKWKENRGVLLCTISFAQSFRIDTTNVAYMLGFSWDPNANYQAEGRLRGYDSIITVPCLVNYIIMEDSVYDDVREVLNDKAYNVNQFMARRFSK